MSVWKIQMLDGLVYTYCKFRVLTPGKQAWPRLTFELDRMRWKCGME
jgi:hypothetical protein